MIEVLRVKFRLFATQVVQAAHGQASVRTLESFYFC